MVKKLGIVLVAIVIILLTWRFCPRSSAALKEGPATPQVQTQSGPVQGFTEDGLNVYLGIPYAEPPSGSLRFKAPVAHKPWTSTLQARSFGSFCPQVYDAVEIDDPKENLSNEDCLTLNIWAPQGSYQKKAVMVFIHGGGFVSGGSKEPFYYGNVLSKKGDVLVVTFNYRVGLLGFFDLSGIAGKDYLGSADNGIQDQLLALRWVKDNIAAFGGDPDNITLFGESAGAASVKSLLGIADPGSLFKRVIIMSGSPLHSTQNTSDISNLITTETGLSWAPLWRYMPTRLVTYIQDKLLAAVGSPLSDLLFGPTYGKDYVIQSSPLEAVASGKTRNIDLMIGTMADEMSYWSFYDTDTDHICDQTVKDNLFTMIDPGVEPRIQALYDLFSKDPHRSTRTEGETILSLGGDYAFRVESLDLAIAQTNVAKTYVYLFNYPVNLPDQPCQNNRAPHGSELPFLFGRIDEKTGQDFIGLARDASDEAIRQKLEDQMILTWSNFAKTGDPNGDGLPHWPAFNASDQPTMVFSGDSHVVNGPSYEEYLAMKAFMETFNVFDALK